MRIAFFSRSWPTNENSGVSLIAYDHAQMLESAGNDILIFGSDPSVQNIKFKTSNYISASGTGSLYSPARVDRLSIRHKLISQKADLVIIEAWQTALTDAAIEEAYKLKLPILVISHGISLHAFSRNFIDVLRSFGWLYYRYIRFPRLVKKITSISTLNYDAKSDRFFDRELALKEKKRVFELANYPINFCSPIDFNEKKNWIVNIGYFSRIKNQKRAIKIFSEFKDKKNYKLVFVGPKRGKYYYECVSLTKKLNLMDLINFYDDEECSISEILEKSKLLMLTSITEAQPVIVCEALHGGIPVLAPPIGAISEIRSIAKCKNDNDYIYYLELLLNNKDKWDEISQSGLKESANTFNKKNVERKLISEVKTLLGDINDNYKS